jgi:hypothetical protein
VLSRAANDYLGRERRHRLVDQGKLSACGAQQWDVHTLGALYQTSWKEGAQ